MKIYCPPEPQAVEIRELDTHDCLLDSRLGRQGYVNKTSMTAAPTAENPTLKKGCEETHQSFFTAFFCIIKMQLNPRHRGGGKVADTACSQNSS